MTIISAVDRFTDQAVPVVILIGGRMQDFGRLLRRGHIFGAHNPPERIGIKLFAHHHLADISRRAPGLPDIFPHPSFIISPANIISDDRCAMCGVKGFCPLIACQPAAPRETKGAKFVILAADDLHALHFAVQRRKGSQIKKFASLIARCVSSQEEASTKGLHAGITRIASASMRNLSISRRVKIDSVFWFSCETRLKIREDSR